MIIYQVLTRLWRSGKFSSFDRRTFDYLHSLGVSHIWFTGVPRHATGEPFVKGDPGSPYSICDWYDVNPYLADDESRRIEEFESLVTRTHKEGFGVIVDFVPNHVACNYGDTSGGIPHWDFCDYDWTDTLKVRYPEATEAMKNVLLWWASKGVDGFRCDMAELIPMEVWRELTAAVRSRYPGIIFIGEVYERTRYRDFIEGAGFDCLYDKSGMYDILRGIMSGSRSCQDLTRNWQELGDLQPHMLNFLENHDEQRLASPQFAGGACNGYAALAVSALFYPAPFMLYFGQEQGEAAKDGCDGRTSIFDWTRKAGPEPNAVTGHYREVLGLSRAFDGAPNFDLCYCQNAEDGFDRSRHFAFLRIKSDSVLLAVCNFSGARADIRIRIPDLCCIPASLRGTINPVTVAGYGAETKLLPVQNLPEVV